MDLTHDELHAAVRGAWLAYKDADAHYREIEGRSAQVTAIDALRGGLVDDLMRAHNARDDAWWAWIDLLREREHDAYSAPA